MAKKKRQPKPRLIPQYDGGYKDRAGRKYTDTEARQLVQQGKATFAQWHGRKKNKASYEGTQYTGGRKKGSGNLKRVDGGYENKHGVRFTEEQKKALDRAVDRSNYQRKKAVAAYDKMSERNSQLRLMGKEPEFIIARQSKSLQGFKSMAEYERYMDKQARIQSGKYLDDMTRLYKRNHMAAIENVFGEEGKGLVMQIRMMKPADYRKLIDNDEFMEVSYIYDPSARAGKLEQIKRSITEGIAKIRAGQI